jgi:hypothetical protein
MLSILRFVLVASVCSLIPLHADTIIFNYSGNGTGIFDGTAFTNAPFQLVFTSIANNGVCCANYIDVTGVLTVAGFPTATLTIPETVEYSPALPVFQLDASLFVTGDINFVGPPNGFYSGGFPFLGGSEWNTWSPESPTDIGPVPFEPWTSPPVYYQTDLGTFALDNYFVGLLNVTVTPEPSYVSITALGMFAVIVLRKFPKLRRCFYPPLRGFEQCDQVGQLP